MTRGVFGVGIDLGGGQLKWPCVSAEVGEDKRCGLWSSLCPITEVLLTSSLLQTACNLLKVWMIVMDG